MPPLEQAVLDETIEQPHERDRLQLEHVGEIDLRQPLLLAQAKEYIHCARVVPRLLAR